MSEAVQLTYPGIAVAVFAQQFCLPVPSILLLMTAGALAAQGRTDLQLWLVVLSGVAGCLAADGIWFWLGRRWGSGVIRLVCSLSSDPKRSRQRSKAIFDKWGLRLLIVAKFVPGLDGLSPPLAGAEGATVFGFVLYDAAGSLFWTGGYVLLGYLFSNQLDKIIELVAHFGRLLLVGVGVPLLVYVIWRLLHLIRIIRNLRLRRISPAMLDMKIAASNKMAVFDLLHFEAHDGAIAGIPGAVRVDPTKLLKAPTLKVPSGVDVVLYCSSRNEFVSARVAEALNQRGFFDVWVLEGGLDAWIKAGKPVTLDMPTPEEVAARLGIVLPANIS